MTIDERLRASRIAEARRSRTGVAGDLKPCPFCGGPPQYYEYSDIRFVTCIDCDAEIGVATNRGGKREVVARWNARTNTGGSHV